MRQKTNVPDGHWHTCHGATPYPPSQETHRIWAIPTSGLGRGWGAGGGSGPLDPPPPRPAPPLDKLTENQTWRRQKAREMTIDEWPETEGRRPVGDRQPPHLRPSPRLYSRSVCLSSSRDAVGERSAVCGCLVNCSRRVV